MHDCQIEIVCLNKIIIFNRHPSLKDADYTDMKEGEYAINFDQSSLFAFDSSVGQCLIPVHVERDIF